MNAILCTKYGPPQVLKIKEVDKPEPKDNEVLIKVHAAAVTISDCIVRSGKVNPWLWLPMRLFVGFGKPRRSVLGLELSGVIEKTGRSIRRFHQGDQVFAFTGRKFGAYADYVCLREDGISMPNDSLLALKPANSTFEEAATVPSRGTLALHFLKKGNIQSGQRVLIYGASGGVGSFAVQIARYLGAEVTGVCSTSNLEWVKSLGADHVIDYSREGLTDSEETYDLIFNAVGNRYNKKSQIEKFLSPMGKYVSVDDGTPKILLDDLLMIKELIENGAIKPVLDRCYAMSDIVEAHRYIEKGHKKGNVVIKITD